jgi:phospholipid N-methyltransferase
VAQKGEAATLVFAKNFFMNPRMLGSVIPSSRFLIRQLLRHVDWERAKVVVEFGPGVGTISRAMLRRMGRDARLVAFEINGEFVRHLEENFADPRFTVVNRSATEACAALPELGLGAADYIVAGIPFSILPDDVRESVLRGAHSALRPGGELLVYQFSAKVRGDLERIFGRVDEVFELRNILPARVFRCVRQ